MRVLTFGSTGLAGRFILAELINRQHNVTAFVRNRNRINPPELLSSTHLTVFEGDVLNKALVQEVLASKQFDAIISTICDGAEITDQVESKGSRNIIDALKNSENKPRYFLFLNDGMLDVTTSDGKTAWWQDTPSDKPDAEDLRPLYDEHELVYTMVIKEKDWLKYTFFCPPEIATEAADEQYVVTTTRLPATQNLIFAGTLAKIVVDELTNQAFIGERVAMQVLSDE
jgi:putative NADH-flavin reductase